eukprot:g25714.t1
MASYSSLPQRHRSLSERSKHRGELLRRHQAALWHRVTPRCPPCLPHSFLGGPSASEPAHSSATLQQEPTLPERFGSPEPAPTPLTLIKTREAP